MLVSDIFTEIRNEADVNSTKVSDSYLTTGINLDHGELIQDVLDARGDINFNVNEAYTDLISTSGLSAGSTGYNGEYTWPTDLIKPQRIEVSFDGTYYYPAKVYDINDPLSQSEFNSTQIQTSFYQNNPYVRFERNSYFIRPLKTTTGNVTNGIHIWYEQRQSSLTSSDTPTIEPNFHRLYVLMGVLRIMRRFRKEYSLNDREEMRVEIASLRAKFINFYGKQVQENIPLVPTYINYR